MALHMFGFVDIPDMHLFKKTAKNKNLRLTSTKWVAWITDNNSPSSLLFEFESLDKDNNLILPEAVKIQWPEQANRSAALNFKVRFMR